MLLTSGDMRIPEFNITAANYSSAITTKNEAVSRLSVGSPLPTDAIMISKRLLSYKKTHTIYKTLILPELLYGIKVFIHIYIIGHYNPLVRLIDPVSHTTYVVCVNCINKWRDL